LLSRSPEGRSHPDKSITGPPRLSQAKEDTHFKNVAKQALCPKL
jgi:hypothetical protein